MTESKFNKSEPPSKNGWAAVGLGWDETTCNARVVTSVTAKRLGFCEITEFHPRIIFIQFSHFLCAHHGTSFWTAKRKERQRCNISETLLYDGL